MNQNKPAPSDAGGFARGGPSSAQQPKPAAQPEKKNEKGDDSWSMSGGKARQIGKK